MAATAQQEALRHYEQDGYVVFRNVIDTTLVAEAGRHLEWLIERNPGVSPEQLHHELVRDDPFWVRLVSDPRLLDVAELFVGPNIALFASHYISKPAYTGRPVLWHQDSAYWPLEPMEVVTLWLAVDDSLPENGCLRVIKGSHRLATHAIERRNDVDSVLGSGMDESLVDESNAVDIVLRAGDVEVHHPNIVHGSNANSSPLRRCGLTIRYIPTSTRIGVKVPEREAPEPWPCAFLLRGEAVPGTNTYNPFPRYVEGTHLPFAGCEDWA